MNTLLNVLKENLYMTIAVTTKDMCPWIANLYYAFDDKFNLYWYSNKDSVHSTMIRSNPNIAISVFNSTVTGEDVDAIYIKATAEELIEKDEIIHAADILGKSLQEDKFLSPRTAREFIEGYSDFMGKSKVRIYRATPKNIYKLGPTEMYNNKFIDRRIEIKLK